MRDEEFMTGEVVEATPDASSELASDESTGSGDSLEEIRAAVSEEMDKVIPHVVAALKANEATRAMADRLNQAEKKLAERDGRPIVSRLVTVLQKVRRLDFDPEVKQLIASELEDVLVGAGYTEFGDSGDAFDPAIHEAVDGIATDGEAVVIEVLEPGLDALGLVVVRARVRVGQSSPDAGQEIDKTEE